MTVARVREMLVAITGIRKGGLGLGRRFRQRI
jgi:hypothetical protein